MKKVSHFILTFILWFPAVSVQAWNALGHRLIGQIAYNHLNQDVKERVDFYNQALDPVFHRYSFVNAAPWMDTLRYVNDVWMKTQHYIDIPFSFDGTALIQPEEPNALTAIAHARQVLSQKQSSDYDKGFSIRILLHVIGDLHQPMHASDQFSKEHPDGDRGGNLYYLGNNPIAQNLHAYWDKGGGLLGSSDDVDDAHVVLMAKAIEDTWPCDLSQVVVDPTAWSQESFQLAVDKAYSIKLKQSPDEYYQKMVQKTTEQRIAVAGCRLAKVLNNR